MAKRTALHTLPERIEEYARLARDTLASFEADVERLLESNHRELDAWPFEADVERLLESNHRELDAWPSSEVRDQELTERMELQSWVRFTTQELADLLYLLAVGDNGPTVVADCDPQEASKQAHYDRRRSALDRLEERGRLT